MEFEESGLFMRFAPRVLKPIKLDKVWLALHISRAIRTQTCGGDCLGA